jgi:hypothetical protein
MSRPSANPSLDRAPADQAAATVIPRGSARLAGIPAGDAASIRAAIPAGSGLQPRRGNAERDDDDNAVRALTTPTRNPNPGTRAAGRNAGFLASAPGDRDYLPGSLSIRDTG